MMSSSLFDRASGIVAAYLENMASNLDGSNLGKKKGPRQSVTHETLRSVSLTHIVNNAREVEPHLPSVSYVSESLPCLPLWMFLMCIDRRGEGNHPCSRN